MRIGRMRIAGNSQIDPLVAARGTAGLFTREKAECKLRNEPPSSRVPRDCPWGDSPPAEQDRFPMTNSNSNPGPEPDPLSATGMFLRAFDQDAKKESKPEDPFGLEPARPASAAPVPPKAATPPPSAGSGQGSGQGPGQGSGQKSGPGEFTSIFNSLGPRP